MYKDFSGIKYLENENKELVVIGYEGNEKGLSIPFSINDKPVVEIMSYSFSHSELKRITIPHTVKTINESAFYASSLDRVVFTGESTDIMAFVFAYTSCLNHIDLPKNISTIPGYGFSHSKLKSCDWHKASCIKECAFLSSGLEKADFSNVQLIYSGAFKNCENLKEIIWGDNLQLIGEEAFSGIPISGETVKIPQSVEIMRDNVFGDANITLLIPETIEEIGRQKQSIIFY